MEIPQFVSPFDSLQHFGKCVDRVPSGPETKTIQSFAFIARGSRNTVIIPVKFDGIHAQRVGLCPRAEAPGRSPRQPRIVPFAGAPGRLNGQQTGRLPSRANGILSRFGASLRHHFKSNFEVPMSGHSKWATIKHKKGALDAKRGKIFTRLLKEIAVAAKGGGNPDTNARLRTAVAAAKAENMPQDNIKRAIQRGTGELEGVSYEEISFEGYGPGGVAIIVDVTTDNRNRAVSEIRHAFSKNGGNLGESGSVRFMFSKKGLIAIEKSAATEEQLMDIVLEHGGEDLNDEGDTWEVITEPASFEAVVAAIKAAGIPTVMSEVTMVASTYTKLEGSAANQMIRLLETLEDCDDTQNVYSNFDMDAEQMEHAAG